VFFFFPTDTVKLLKKQQKSMRIFVFSTLILSVLDGFCQINAHVVRVKDGDTFVALWGGKTYNCRLTNIDAPELKQSYGVASKDSLSQLVLGKMVTLDSLKKDLYGRVLVNVRLGSVRLDSLLIRKGWAWHYVGFSHDAMLENAMEIACTQGVGLWRCGKSTVCPPWLYRHFKTRNHLRYCVGC
jgi:micrococcal nuclease